jgi:hypothetical protein
MVAVNLMGAVGEEMGWGFGAFRLASGMPIDGGGGDILIPLVVFTLTRAWGTLYRNPHGTCARPSYD